MKIVPLTDPDEITAQLRLREIYRRQREEAGFGKVDPKELSQEADIVIRLLELDVRMRLNIAGEIVRKSLERQ